MLEAGSEEMRSLFSTVDSRSLYMFVDWPLPPEADEV